MPSRVIGIVYAHRGGMIEAEASNETKRLLRGLNNSIQAATGLPVYTKFGDPRGRAPDGTPVLGYALCMSVTAAQVPWLLQTFWGEGRETFVEVIPGVGYIEKSKGRVPMLALDVEKGDEAAKELATKFGVDWSPEGKPRAGRSKGPDAPTDPYGDTLNVIRLCQAAIPGFDVTANLSTPRDELVRMYEATLVFERPSTEDSDTREQDPELLADLTGIDEVEAEDAPRKKGKRA